MNGDTPSPETYSIGGSDLLTEIIEEFRAERAALLVRWHDALRHDALKGAESDTAASPEFEKIVDHYLEALESGSAYALQHYAREMANGYPPFQAGNVGFLAALLSLRDVLARSLSARLGRSSGRLVAALDTFERSANGVSESVALGIFEEYAHVIRQQQDAIRQLTTPVLQVRAGLLIHPIIGNVDIHRARQLTSDLLESVRSRRARVVVMDLTGVPTLDIEVATQLIRAVEAVRLVGATLIISGISPEAARALAATALDLSALNAVGDLEDGMTEAEARLGLYVGQRAGSSLATAND